MIVFPNILRSFFVSLICFSPMITAFSADQFRPVKFFLGPVNTVICSKDVACKNKKSPKARISQHTTKPTRSQQKTVIIDPGHGGVYWGQVSIHGKLIEKNVVLDIAKRVAKRLKKKGYNVILTRTTDTQFDKKDLLNDLACRAHFTRMHKADIFVSLHLNGSKNKGIRGFEVYVPYESKYPIRSYTLASCFHYELSHKIKPIFGGGTLGNHNNIDHGIRASKFNVLTKANCAAVVLELDYLTNADSELLLSSSRYKEVLTNAIYCGIRRYFQQ